MPVLRMFIGEPSVRNGASMAILLWGLLHLVPLVLQPLVLDPFALGSLIGRFRIELAQLQVEFFQCRFRNGLFDGSVLAFCDFQSTPV